MDYKVIQKKKGFSQVFLNLLTMPFIWAPFIPTMFVDLLSEIYVQICFPIYGLEKPKRSDFIMVLDRNKLQYLSASEKLGCMYCGYMNGVYLYLKEISGQTESYWCGIMHEKVAGRNFRPQQHQVEQNFVEFGDEKSTKSRYGD